MTLALATVAAAAAPAAFGTGVLPTNRFDYGSDPMRYLENDRLKVGIDLSLGGAVTFLSDRENGGENMINSFDWGRQIQLSFYNQPSPYIGPNGEAPRADWAMLGWNPIQSGDCGGNRSRVTHFAFEGENAMRVRCVPMQWPIPAGVSGDCEFECVYTLEGNVMRLQAKIFVDRPDTTQYTASPQEMPALYTNGRWYRLFSYLGARPFQDAPVTEIVGKGDGKGWPWVSFMTPERWAALLDEDGTGIGVYQPLGTHILGGFHGGDGNKGHGGVKSTQTGYIAPTTRQILDHNIVWGYETAFVLGTLDDIRGYARRREEGRVHAWSFAEGRDGWHYGAGARDKGWPIQGALEMAYPAGGTLVGPDTFLPVRPDAALEMEAAFAAAGGAGGGEAMPVTVTLLPVGPSDMTDWLLWDGEAERRAKADAFPAAVPRTVASTVRCDGVNRVYSIPIGGAVTDCAAIKTITLTFGAQGTATVKRIAVKAAEGPEARP